MDGKLFCRSCHHCPLDPSNRIVSLIIICNTFAPTFSYLPTSRPPVRAIQADAIEKRFLEAELGLTRTIKKLVIARVEGYNSCVSMCSNRNLSEGYNKGCSGETVGQATWGHLLRPRNIHTRIVPIET